MTVYELEVLKATKITAKDIPISMNAASERLQNFAIEWEEHNERFENINPFFVALRIVRDKSLEWEAQEPKEVIYNNEHKSVYCPSCDNRLAGLTSSGAVTLETEETPNYCWMCGQAVKW